MPVDEGYQGGGGNGGQDINVPVPDPSLLTTQHIRNSIENLRELIGARLDAMDQATELRLERFHDVPAQTDEKVQRLQDLHETKFAGIALQFHERDTRTDQTAATSKQALDAALLAAKELVGQQNEANAAAATKAELSTIKQIDQIVVLVGTIEKALGAQIIEIKERIDRNEGGIAGGRNVTESRRADSSLTLSVIVAVFLFVSVATGIIVAVMSHK